MESAAHRRMNAREAVALRFVNISRARHENNRRAQYRPDTLLTLWATWEKVRDQCAIDVAEAAVNGWDASLPEYVSWYRVAVERMTLARSRYVAAVRGADFTIVGALAEVTA